MTRHLLLLALCLPVAALAQPLRVLSTSPTPQALTADADTPIEVTFDQALDAATVTAASFRVFGRWSGPAVGTLAVEGPTVRFVPDAPFFAGEWVTVSVSRAVETAGGTPLEGYAYSFWIRTAPASMNLSEAGQLSTRLPREPRIQSYGAYGGDLDGDGWSDLAIPNEQSNDLRVFLNDGAGGYDGFVIHPLPNSSVPSTNEGGDFNGDGLTDLAVGNIGNDQVSVMIGDGEGGFSEGTGFEADSGVRGLCVLDLDGDGRDDLVTANRSAGTVTVLRGLGDGTFEDPVFVETGTDGETACAAADANGDGFTDVFIGAFGSGEITTLLSDGEGGLSVGSQVQTGTDPWMLAVGDLNGDGHVDVVSSAAAFSSPYNVVALLGDGAGGLGAPDRYRFGRFSVAIDLGDVDGDGDLDMVSSNFSSRDFDLFENLGDGSFAEPVSYAVSSTGAGSCAVFHDRDNDGDLDMTGIDELDDILYFYENPGTTDAEAGPDAAFDLSLYPNPTGDQAALDLALPVSGAVTVRVLDALGRIVFARDAGVLGAGPHTLRVPTRGLVSGTYLVLVETAAGTVSRRLTLTR
ncbi:MAG: FG-GAP-like repeat-containing protein [Bacteroidota bacterium]